MERTKIIGSKYYLRCKFCGWSSKDKDILITKNNTWEEDEISNWKCPNCMRWLRARWFKIRRKK